MGASRPVSAAHTRLKNARSLAESGPSLQRDKDQRVFGRLPVAVGWLCPKARPYGNGFSTLSVRYITPDGCRLRENFPVAPDAPHFTARHRRNDHLGGVLCSPGSARRSSQGCAELPS
jgi:hypothetical protein